MRFLLLLLLPGFCFAQSFSPSEVARYSAEASRVTIVRDSWDIPHIYGKTDADAVFGLLYAQCEENFPRVERNYLEMMGRLSEIEGKGQLYQDLQMRLLYDTAAARIDYLRSPAWFQKLLDAFADGVNYYLYTHPQVQPIALSRFQPWFPLMYTDGSIAPTQTGGLTMQDMKNLYTLSDGSTSYTPPPRPFFDVDPTGSNGLALAPARTASGNAILYINPHVTFYFRSEVHMVSDEGLNAYGAVTWGQFFIYQGFNEHCGWMHTSSYADVADLFAEKTVRRSDSLLYQYDDKLLPAKTRAITIIYKDKDALRREVFTTYATVHGPVMGSRNGRWLSLRENNRSLDALIQSWMRTKAKGFEDFKRIMGLRANNSNNTVFADDKGNIAYWHGNFMPRRDPKIDYSLPVDGSTSGTNWQGVHALDEIVHVYNPASGWIENCNSTPFTVSGTASPRRQDYPTYMAPDGQNFRAINAARLLEAAHGIKMEEVISRIGYSHYLSAFEVLLPPLLKDYAALPEGDALKARLGAAMSLLKEWNYNSSDTSVATTVAIEWAYRMAQKATPPDNPYKISDGVAQVNSMVSNTTPAQRLQLLDETLDDLKKRFGKWQVGWGFVNRYQRVPGDAFDDKKESFAVGLAAATWGCLPSFATRRLPNTDRRYGYSGNSFVACVEFGKKIKAKTVITGGQSFDPKSPHYTDQAERYIHGDFKDVFFYRPDVLQHAVRQYHPGS